MLAGCSSNDPATETDSPGENGSGNQDDTDTPENDTDTPGEIQKGGEISVGINQDPDTLHPHHTRTRVSNMVQFLVMNQLMTYDPQYRLHPNLAREMPEVLDDGRTQVYTIHEGVQFHEPFKKEMKASDVVWNVRRLLDPEYGSPIQGRLADLLVEDPEEAVQETGEYEITFNLNDEYTPSILQWLLREGKMSIISPEAAEEHGDDFGTSQVGTFGTGPFMFEEATEGNTYAFTRNPDYFKETEAGQLPYLDRVELNVMEEDSTRVTAVQTGDVDVGMLIPANNVADLENDEDLTVQSTPGFSHQNQFLNMRRFEPFTKLSVREALKHATNREAIVNIAANGKASASWGPLPPNYDVYDDDALVKFPYDPQKAKDLLSEAGESDLSFESLVTNQALYMDMAEMIQQNMKEAGIDLELTPVGSGAAWEQALSGSWDTDPVGVEPETWQSHVEDFGPGPSPIDKVMRPYYTGRFLNVAYYSNEQVDSWIEELMTTADENRQRELFSNLQNQISKDCIHNHVMYVDVIHAQKKTIQNLPIYGTKILFFEETWVEQ
jgi:peptide/nickel transport system substrate-binding protein